MWGYISWFHYAFKPTGVPSLYVRVYRQLLWTGRKGLRSLIICEGISWWHYSFKPTGLFPHYMWGYIVNLLARFLFLWVPSLYVRVYRFKPGDTRINYGSLIICEGISEHVQEAAEMLPFPHYMWGYIGHWKNVRNLLNVPSLYVRVYPFFWIIPHF